MSDRDEQEEAKKQLAKEMWQFLDWYSGAPREEKKLLVHRMLDICDKSIDQVSTRRAAEARIDELGGINEFQNSLSLPYEVGIKPYIEGRLAQLQPTKGSKDE